MHSVGRSLGMGQVASRGSECILLCRARNSRGEAGGMGGGGASGALVPGLIRYYTVLGRPNPGKYAIGLQMPIYHFQICSVDLFSRYRLCMAGVRHTDR